MATKKKKSSIRRDIIAVKERQAAVDNQWVFVFMSTRSDLAANYASTLGRGGRSIVTLVHPSQRIVDMFLMAGNKIY